RRVIRRLEGNDSERYLEEYTDPTTDRYQEMTATIGRELNFSSLLYHRLDDMIASVGIDPCKLCTYCWNGKE
ncbi:MAG: amidophosphoribosyltransferase, partial [Lachnospiraceae bacterium]|nr:amidophosphoribosyltransferase [Lachnospiraceae bacterium]